MHDNISYIIIGVLIVLLVLLFVSNRRDGFMTIPGECNAWMWGECSKIKDSNDRKICIAVGTEACKGNIPT